MPYDLSSPITNAAGIASRGTAEDLNRLVDEANNIRNNETLMRGQDLNSQYNMGMLGVQQRQQQHAEQNQKVTQWVNTYKLLNDTLMQSAKDLRTQGVPPEQIPTTLKDTLEVAKQYEALAQQLGVPIVPGTAQQLLASALTQPTAVQTGTLTGQTKAAELDATANGIGNDPLKRAIVGLGYKPTDYGVVNPVSGEYTVSPEVVGAKATAARAANPSSASLNGQVNDTVLKYQQSLGEEVTNLKKISYMATRAQQLLATQNVDKFADVREFLQGAGKSLGVDLGLLDNSEQGLRKGAQVVDLALAMEYQKFLKGATSERDMTIVLNMPPSIKDSPLGREITAHLYREFARRAELIEQAGARAIQRAQPNGVIGALDYQQAIAAERERLDQEDVFAGTPYRTLLEGAEASQPSQGMQQGTQGGINSRLNKAIHDSAKQ